MFSNIRFYVLLTTSILIAGIYLKIRLAYPETSTQIIFLVQYYALLSITYLYLALMASPVTRFFTFLPFRGEYLHARRALGVSAFVLGAIHGTLAFFGELGGFGGLEFLSDKYLLSISLSALALLILTIMASTSFDFVVSKFTYRKWKMLHKLVYLASMLIIVHLLLLGSDFTNLSGFIPRVFLIALSLLLVLEAIRLDKYLSSIHIFLPKMGISVVTVVILITAGIFYLSSPQSSVSPLNVHAAHIQLAQQVQQDLSNPTVPTNLPGLQGDRTRRYTASFIHPDSVLPNQDTTLKFRIYDASSGNQASLFSRVYAYPMHLMIVDSTLSYFEHIHPDLVGNEFVITTKFPNQGIYHLYIQCQPLGGIEQQFAFTLAVGVDGSYQTPPSTQTLDTNFTKVFGDYEVTIDTHGGLSAADMTVGKDTITYTIKDAKTKAPITTLKPFMASFGHLTMINQQTYDFIHVHPNNIVAPPPDANGGPSVDFLPIGIYGPFKPGVYRAFGEFSTNIGTDFDTDFTIEVK